MGKGGAEERMFTNPASRVEWQKAAAATLILHAVVVGVVVVPKLGDLATRIVEHSSNDAGTDISEQLVGSLGRPPVRLPGSHHQEHSISQRSQDSGIRRGEHRRCI